MSISEDTTESAKDTEVKYQNLMKLMGDHIEMISQICSNELSLNQVFYEGLYSGLDNNTAGYEPTGPDFFSPAVRTFIKNVLLIMCPIPYQKLTKKIIKIISSQYKYEDIIEEFTDIDKSTKFLRIKPAVEKKLKGKFEPRL
jgi:hypothetical protein